MLKRQFNAFTLISAVSLMAHLRVAQAISWADVTGNDASSGLQLVLEKGAAAAVDMLGAQDGFMGNDKVRIALPGYLNEVAKWFKMMGQGQKVDELVLGMNRAAESAMPMAKDMLVGAVKTMSLSDAKTILLGGVTSATDYFNNKTREPLGVKFLPVITQATAKVGLTEKYNVVAGKAASLGLLKPQQASVEAYVTGKALDGLYLMIAEEEKKIRQNPMASGSALLAKVFGASKSTRLKSRLAHAFGPVARPSNPAPESTPHRYVGLTRAVANLFEQAFR